MPNVNGRLSLFVLGALVLTSAFLVAVRVLGGENGAPAVHDAFVSFDTVDADPDWSPNGRLIAFTSDRGGGGIFVIRPDGSGMRRVFQGAARDVDWSPDGRSLAFVGRGGLYIAPAVGGMPRLVVPGSAVSLPAWAPNGEEIAFVRPQRGVFATYDGSITMTADAIYVTHKDGTGIRRLLPRNRAAVGLAQPGSVGAASETCPAWSPDGKEIAFQAADEVIVVAEIHTARRRTIGRGYEPSWSPDGSLIAYQCLGDVCVNSATGGGSERNIAEGGGDPSWHPDSTLIVFERYLYPGTAFGANPRSLSIVNADGDGLRELTFGPGSYSG